MPTEPPTPAAPRSSLPDLARWVTATLSLCACAAMVTTAWRAHRSSVGLAPALERGIAESFLSEMPGEFGGGPTAEGMRAVLARRHDAGLRALALVDDSGAVRTVVGALDPTPVAPPTRSGGASLAHVHGRVRYLPPMLAPPRPPPGPFGDGPPEPPPRRGPPPPRMLLEFEPLMARAAVAESERTLALAVVISGLLLVAASWFWRRSVRGEDLDRRTLHQDRLAELGKMTAVIAHEIRNPLAAMKGHAQLLAESLDEDSPARAQADRIANASVRLEHLVRDLLDFVREGPVVRRRCDPAALVREAAEEVGVAVEVTARAAVPAVLLDARRLRLALSNLLQNAAQAGAKSVAVGLVYESGMLSVEVADDGGGLDPDDVATVFEPFVTRRTRGVGLGLAVVRRVAQLHGGSVSASNRPGGGALFTLLLQAPPADG
jgi:two-component system sensor histidine kinase HydH